MTVVDDFEGDQKVLVQLGCEIAGQFMMHADTNKGRFAVKMFKLVNKGVSLEQEQIYRWIEKYGDSSGPGKDLIDSAFNRGKYKKDKYEQPPLVLNGSEPEQEQRWKKLEALKDAVKAKCSEEEAHAYLFFVASCARNVAEADAEKNNRNKGTVSDSEAKTLQDICDLFECAMPDYRI